MLCVLDPADYPRVSGLVKNLAEFNVILDAVCADTAPAWVVADRPEEPTSTALFTPEGTFLGGEANNQPFLADLRTVFERAEREPGYWQGGPAISLFLGSPAWENSLNDIFPRRKPGPYARQHYLCSQLGLSDWRDRIPAGFSVERIDAALLERPGLDIPDHVPGWMRGNWGSIEDFTANGGFAFGTIHENAVVSWSVADAAAGDRCEIGIQTRPEYRRRGLASLTAAAAVDYALSSGLREVGWQCNMDNLGSIGTALKVGFHKERDYTAYWYIIRG